MNEVLSVVLAGMHHDMTRMESISQNLANGLTPAYKRSVVVAPPIVNNRFSAVLQAQMDENAGAAAQAVAPGSMATLQPQVFSDVRPGTLKSTGNSLDVALAGEGYFEVVTPAGPAFTRMGTLRLDEKGRLVTAQGYPVVGKGGEIYLSNANPVIDEAGNIFDGAKASGGSPAGSGPAGRLGVATAAGSQPVAQLKVVQFEHPQQLLRAGEGLVLSEESGAVMKDVDVRIRQGFIENSNVSSVQEMVSLMQTMRHFESLQKAATGYDDMLGAAIRRLGDLS